MHGVVPFEQFVQINCRRPFPTLIFDMNSEHLRPATAGFLPEQQAKCLLLKSQLLQMNDVDNTVGMCGTITHLIFCDERSNNVNYGTDVRIEIEPLQSYVKGQRQASMCQHTVMLQAQSTKSCLPT